MTALKIKGEIGIELDGKEYILSPTFACLAKIEAETGKPLQLLAHNALSSTLSCTDTVKILKVCLEKNFDNSEKVFDIIQNNGGYLNFIEPVSKLLIMGITGGRDLVDEKKKD